MQWEASVFIEEEGYSQQGVHAIQFLHVGIEGQKW